MSPNFTPSLSDSHAAISLTLIWPFLQSPFLLHAAISLTLPGSSSKCRSSGLSVSSAMVLIRKEGKLRTFTDIVPEKNQDVFGDLASKIAMRNENLNELEYKYNEKTMSLGSMLDEKDKLHDAFVEETRKMQQLSRDSVLRILEDQEKLSCDLEAWKKKKDDRSINLNKLEDERNKKKMKDELTEKEEKLGSLEELSQTLITKERQSNDELQEARKELIQAFVDILGGRTTIGIEKMGEIDPKPFQNACKQKFSPEEAQVQASTLCFLWQKNLKNPEWHPFKITEGGGNAKPEVLISKCKQYLYLLHMDYNFF